MKGSPLPDQQQWLAKQVVEIYGRLSKSPLSNEDTLILLFCFYTRTGMQTVDYHYLKMPQSSFANRLTRLVASGHLQILGSTSGRRDYTITEKSIELLRRHVLS